MVANAGMRHGRVCDSGRRAIPVVPRMAVALPPAEQAELARIAGRIRRDHPSLGATVFFGDRVAAGLWDGPAALLGDQREIGLHDRMAVQRLEQRIALLADAGDTLICEQSAGAHLDYLQRLLGLGAVEEIALGPPPAAAPWPTTPRPAAPWPAAPRPVALRCVGSEEILGRLAARARAAGRFQVVPHIAAGSAWTLAAAIAHRAGVGVRVAGPPPRLTARVNDKIWFAGFVRQVLGGDALPPTFSVFGPAAAAARVAHVARAGGSVIVKTPDSAGAMGNLRWEAARLRGLPLHRVRDELVALLRQRGWQGQYPLLVGVWEPQVLLSPSVQIWIPEPERGGPLIEGIFEQRVAGAEGEFVGAARAALPPGLARAVATDAMRLAVVLQHLGYVGRCSLDCVVVAAPSGGRAVRWIECNGRWGGVSLPMTLANRLWPEAPPAGFLVVQDMGVALAVRDPRALHAALGELLLLPGGRQGIVPLSTGGLASGRGLHFLAVAESQAGAEALASEARRRLAAANM